MFLVVFICVYGFVYVCTCVCMVFICFLYDFYILLYSFAIFSYIFICFYMISICFYMFSYDFLRFSTISYNDVGVFTLSEIDVSKAFPNAFLIKKLYHPCAASTKAVLQHPIFPRQGI